MSGTGSAMTILDAARAAHSAGLTVLPAAENGTKMPALTEWKSYQTERPRKEQLAEWFNGGHERAGMGVLTGATSGVEAFDFDDFATYEAYVAAARAMGLGEIVDSIECGFLEATPKGGRHWLYRCSVIDGNTKLAQRPTPTTENPHLRQALIETRGEGGWIVTHPSHGPVHASGRPYKLMSGGFATIATITPDERGSLFRLARSFDEVPPPEAAIVRSPRTVEPGAEGRPGDDFNMRADWHDVLDPHAWTECYRTGDKIAWKRPGKDEPGLSATTGYGGSDLLYVFSSSTPFEPERGYNKFSAFAVLNHNGDFAAAARDLASKGFGTPTTKPQAPVGTEPRPAGSPAPVRSEPPARRIRLTPASEIEIVPVSWIWDTAGTGAKPWEREGRFPEGALVIAAGRAGLGKSQFAVWMAAALTRGTLPGSFWGKPRSVVYAASEDSWGMTIAPRLVAAGADLRRVFRIDVISDGDENARLTLPLDTDQLEDVFVRHDVALVVLDPMLSLLDGAIDDYRARDVRGALEPLVALADRARVTLLGIAHFTKATGSDPLLLIAGSGAFGQLIRAGVGFARDDEGGYVLSTIKNNLGREDLPSLTYAIEPVAVPTSGGETWVSRFALSGAPAPRSVAEILRERDDGEGQHQQREIDGWLTDYLKDSGGSAPAAEVIAAGRAAGWSDGDVKKARMRIKAESTRAGFGKGASYTWRIMDSMDSYTHARESMESMMEEIVRVDVTPTCSTCFSAPAAPASVVCEDCARRSVETEVMTI